MATCSPARRIVIAAMSAIALLPAIPVTAQSPTYGVGRPPTADELEKIHIDALPDGHGLPPGSGIAERGRTVYASRCAVCHGPTGREGPQDVLVGGAGTLNSARPVRTIGSYWPYATTLFDYINRAMPFDHPGTLGADDVYALTAYLLNLNGIIGEHDVMDQKTLPKVQMPNRGGFVPDRRPDVGPKEGNHEDTKNRKKKGSG